MNNKNFLENPSKKTLLIFTLISVIGWTLLYYGMTDDNGKITKFNLMIGFIILSNFVVVLKLYINYFKNKE